MTEEQKRQLAIIKTTIQKNVAKGMIYYDNSSDSQLLDQFFLDNNPSEAKIKEYVTANAIDDWGF